MYIYDSPRKKLTFIVVKLHPSKSTEPWSDDYYTGLTQLSQAMARCSRAVRQTTRR
ncbi:MAG: hypothetical protein ACYT04_09390 [Nostoc sp.]